METIIKRVKKGQLDKDSIEMAGAILKKGGLVAFPTETVYGLGADALNEKAAEKIYLVLAGAGDEQIGPRDVGLEQHTVARTVAADAHYVKGIDRVIHILLVFVDDDDVVILARQLFCQGAAHLTVADNDDTHNFQISKTF